MTLEEALKSAIDYEIKVRDVYAEACETATNKVGKRVFKALAAEEQGHVDFLHHKLDEWKETGHVTADDLTSALPSRAAITAGIAKLENRLAADDSGIELKMLKKALEVERETGAFYRQMAQELTDDGQELFACFVKIEDGHEALVQAEIDCVGNSGFWFDMMEFDLEMG